MVRPLWSVTRERVEFNTYLFPRLVQKRLRSGQGVGLQGLGLRRAPKEERLGTPAKMRQEE
jgi:hypothetical protein